MQICVLAQNIDVSLKTTRSRCRIHATTTCLNVSQLIDRLLLGHTGRHQELGRDFYSFSPWDRFLTSEHDLAETVPVQETRCLLPETQ